MFPAVQRQVCCRKGAKVVLLNRDSLRADEAFGYIKAWPSCPVAHDAPGHRKGQWLAHACEDQLRPHAAWFRRPAVSECFRCTTRLGKRALRRFVSVRDAAAKMNSELRESGLDVLCNNAGIMGSPAASLLSGKLPGFGDIATEDGCDIQRLGLEVSGLFEEL